jgi:hypothetical protein
MANPANPFDKFVTYTYHFELHASPSWDSIGGSNGIRFSDKNSKTYADKPIDTLLINTRQDANQIIDDVKFGYIGSSVNKFGQYMPDGHMTLKVTEPSRVYFMEKLSNLMKMNKVSSLGSLHWALKVFFIGRDADNNIISLPKNGITIPMQFIDMISSFTYKGGEYNMSFVTSASFAGSSVDRAKANVFLAGYCNKDIHVFSKSVKSAITELEKLLNENYRNTYKYDLKNTILRNLTYKINIDPKIIDGPIDYAYGKTSTAPADGSTFAFSKDQSIATWIFEILRSSTVLNKLVSESINGIRKEYHPGVKFFSVYPSTTFDENEILITYNIHLYEGANSEIQGLAKNIVEFDFMFGAAGSNVDVLGFDMHMTSALGWFANPKISSDSVTGQSGTVSSNQTVHEDKNSQILSIFKRYNPSLIPGYRNDIAYLPPTCAADDTGLVKYKESAKEPAKIMFNTVSEMHGAFNAQLTLTIRGHLDLLKTGIVWPLTTLGKLEDVPFGVLAPLWVKVNVKSPNENNLDGTHENFFYRGLYNVLSIENHFSNGQFIQTLSVLMMGDGMNTVAAVIQPDVTSTTPQNKQVTTAMQSYYRPSPLGHEGYH